MHLLNVELQNFKSIHKARAENLGKINIFFGPTNSGKTSFLESIYFQSNHQRLGAPEKYHEFLHSKADPKDSVLEVKTEWVVIESIPEVNLRPHDTVRCVTTVQFSSKAPAVDEQVFINNEQEGNIERQTAIFLHLRNSVKLSSSRRPGDSKRVYFPGEDEEPEARKQRFLQALGELELQGNQYHEFLSYIQKMFPHLVYDTASKENILDFFGLGFMGTAKLFVYLFDARYSLVLIDEPEIHFYPSLTHRFVQTLYEVSEKLGKQIILSTHSTIFLHERHLGNFYHITKTSDYLTSVRRVEQGNLLLGLDLLNAPPESILQSDMVIYVEGPWDVAVMNEFLVQYPELDHVNIVVLQLGGGAMGNGNVDPNQLKIHNPLSFVLIDSERKSKDGDADPSHQDFIDRCHNAKVYCLMLEKQAIENYFTPRALREVYGDRIPRNFVVKPYLPLTHQGLKWFDKADNRRIAHAMTREEIDASPDLKSFFDELIKVSNQVQ